MTPDELEGRLDAYMVKMMDGIHEHGWMIQGVFGTADDPGSFSYTAGLTGTGHPELFIDTLAPNQAGGILNAVARLVRDDKLTPRQGEQFDAEYSCPFAWHGPIDADEAEVNTTRSIYGRDITVWQVLWPDTEGRFPGADGYDDDRFPQRLMPLA